MKNKDIKIGEFREFTHPPDAEQLLASDYKFYRQAPSGILPGKTIEQEWLLCPYCNTESQGKDEHGAAYECGTCGLKRQIFGNYLYIWIE